MARCCSDQVLQVIPASCCLTDRARLPALEPLDSHCVFVPTTYNSHWARVSRS